MNAVILPRGQQLIKDYDFNRDCAVPEISRLTRSYLDAAAVKPLTVAAICSEVSELQQLVLGFSNSLAPNYLNLLYGLGQQLSAFNHEAELLELLIPYWYRERGVTLAPEKLVDEFYFEFEMVTLWVLVAQCMQTQSFLAPALLKMRAIIRRYSNMPSLWLYLWDISDDELKSGYTF